MTKEKKIKAGDCLLVINSQGFYMDIEDKEVDYLRLFFGEKLLVLDVFGDDYMKLLRTLTNQIGYIDYLDCVFQKLT